MRARIASLFLLAATALASLPACRPVSAESSLGSSPPRSGGSAVGWDATQWSRCHAILGSQIDNYDWSPLTNPNDYTASVFAQLDGESGGVLRSGVGSSSLTFGGGVNAVNTVGNISTNAFCVAARLRFAASPSGAGKEFDLAGVDGSTDKQTLLLLTNDSTTVAELFQSKSGGGTTKTACGSAGTVGSGITVGAWFDAMMVSDPTKARVVTTINGNTCVISTNLTNQSTQSAKPSWFSNQTSALDIDAIFFAYKQSL